MILVNLNESEWFARYSSKNSILSCVYSNIGNKSIRWAHLRDSLGIIVYSTKSNKIIRDYTTNLHTALTPYSKSDAIQTDLKLFQFIGLIKTPDSSGNTAFLLDEGFQIVHANNKEEWFLLQCKYPDIIRVY